MSAEQQTENRRSTRLALLAILEARVVGDSAAWDALWPETGEQSAELLVAAIELLVGSLLSEPEPLAEIARIRQFVLGIEVGE